MDRYPNFPRPTHLFDHALKAWQTHKRVPALRSGILPATILVLLLVPTRRASSYVSDKTVDALMPCPSLSVRIDSVDHVSSLERFFFQGPAKFLVLKHSSVSISMLIYD